MRNLKITKVDKSHTIPIINHIGKVAFNNPMCMIISFVLLQIMVIAVASFFPKVSPSIPASIFGLSVFIIFFYLIMYVLHPTLVLAANLKLTTQNTVRYCIHAFLNSNWFKQFVKVFGATIVVCYIAMIVIFFTSSSPDILSQQTANWVDMLVDIGIMAAIAYQTRQTVIEMCSHLPLDHVTLSDIEYYQECGIESNKTLYTWCFYIQFVLYSIAILLTNIVIALMLWYLSIIILMGLWYYIFFNNSYPTDEYEKSAKLAHQL